MRALIFICSVLTISGAAFADPPPESPHGPPAPYARALFITPMGEPFRADDVGGRGIDAWFAAADTDHDGRISRAEFDADALHFFDQLDANQDGAATSVESTSFWERHAPEMIGRLDLTPPIMDQPTSGHSSERQHHNSGGDYEVVESEGSRLGSGTHNARPAASAFANRTGAARFGLLNDAEPVMTCDANFDRRVTREEFQACADRRFVLIDANGDGFFSKDEAAAQR